MNSSPLIVSVSELEHLLGTSLSKFKEKSLSSFSRVKMHFDISIKSIVFLFGFMDSVEIFRTQSIVISVSADEICVYFNPKSKGTFIVDCEVVDARDFLLFFATEWFFTCFRKLDGSVYRFVQPTTWHPYGFWEKEINRRMFGKLIVSNVLIYVWGLHLFHLLRPFHIY